MNKDSLTLNYTTADIINRDLNISKTELMEGLYELERLNLIRILPNGEIIDLQDAINQVVKQCKNS